MMSYSIGTHLFIHDFLALDAFQSPFVKGEKKEIPRVRFVPHLCLLLHSFVQAGAAGKAVLELTTYRFPSDCERQTRS